jgi:hypothetical protein
MVVCMCVCCKQRTQRYLLSCAERASLVQTVCVCVCVWKVMWLHVRLAGVQVTQCDGRCCSTGCVWMLFCNWFVPKGGM